MVRGYAVATQDSSSLPPFPLPLTQAIVRSSSDSRTLRQTQPNAPGTCSALPLSCRCLPLSLFFPSLPFFLSLSNTNTHTHSYSFSLSLASSCCTSLYNRGYYCCVWDEEGENERNPERDDGGTRRTKRWERERRKQSSRARACARKEERPEETKEGKRERILLERASREERKKLRARAAIVCSVCLSSIFSSSSLSFSLLSAPPRCFFLPFFFLSLPP